MKLIEPTMEYEKEIWTFRQEFLLSGGSMDGCSALKKFDNIQDWIDRVNRCKLAEALPANRVPATQFIYIRENDNKMIGAISVRHYLSDYLQKYFGHIGYSVCPSERKKGYATQMLKDVLPVCKLLGIYDVLISCERDNEGSRKVILKNGGVYEDMVYESKENIFLEKYWIHLA